MPVITALPRDASTSSQAVVADGIAAFLANKEYEIRRAAEVGLGGEVRAVLKIENRIVEAEKLGFKTIFVSKYNLKGIDVKKYKIEIRGVAKLDEAFRGIF